MTERYLEDNLRCAIKSDMPKGLLTKIEDACTKVEQLEREPVETVVIHPRLPMWLSRMIGAAVCLLCLVVGIVGGALLRPLSVLPEAESDARVYLDVNPSIELEVSDEDRVLSYAALNSDAEAILDELSLEGVELNTAVTAIIGSLYVNGYLTVDSNSVLVSVDAEEARSKTLISSISTRISDMFKNSEMECSVIAQKVTASDELKALAKENNVSVGKMELVDKLVCELEELTDEDIGELVDMKIHELNFMYKNRESNNDDDGREDNKFSEDISSGSLGGYANIEDSIKSALEQLLLSSDSIVTRSGKIGYQYFEGERRLVYTVTVKLDGEDYLRAFKFDCVSGELLESGELGENGSSPTDEGNTPSGPHGDGEDDGELRGEDEHIPEFPW